MRLAFLRKPERAETRPYRQAFVDKMTSIQSGGVDFEALARQTVKEKLGEATENLLFSGLSEKARKDPRYFLVAVQRLFGDGDSGVLTPMIAAADQGRFPKRRVDQVAELESHVAKLPPSSTKPGVSVGGRTHRVYDENGNLVQEEDSEWG